MGGGHGSDEDSDRSGRDSARSGSAQSSTAQQRDSAPEKQSPAASVLSLPEKQARLCYALCKQTIVHEHTEGLARYDKLSVVEFLELLGRIAVTRFEGTEFENEPLVKRLEYVVEAALATVGLTRADPHVQEEEESSESAQEDY